MQNTTVDINSEAHQRFESLFGSFEAGLNGQKSNPLHQMRLSAIEKLKQIKFPTLRDEDWKYTSVQKVLKHKYSLESTSKTINSIPENLMSEDFDAINLVFANGVFQRHLSNSSDGIEGLAILTLEDALKSESFKQIVLEYLDKEAKANTNPFFHLNTAFTRHGLFVHLEKNVRVERPIHIIHLSQSTDVPIYSAPLQVFHIGQSADLKVIESYTSLDSESIQPVLTTSHNHFYLEKQAKCVTYKLQKISKDHFLIHDSKADQNRDSVYTAFTIDLGGQITRNNASAVHLGENVLSNLYGVFLGKNEQHIDNQTFIDHAMPNCQSNEWYKGILDDKSRGVFNGKVMVRQDAQKINAFQQNNALILSEFARMDTKPQLEIFADDVRCSHGATIGQIDEEAIFYLRSRGLSKSSAMLIMQLAFLQEVTAFIEDKYIQEFLESWISTSFKDMN